jgi:membrane protein YqaA with SNARE-associated domain
MFIGDHGLYAVFALMLLDSVLPAASELVMLYAGVLASGALPGQDIVLFGHQIDSHFWGYVAIATAGVAGQTVGSIIGWAIGLYGGRPLVERHGRWLHLGPENLDRAEHWFDRWGDWAHAARPLHAVLGAGHHPVVLRDRGRGLGARLQLGVVPSRLPVRRSARRSRDPRAPRVVSPPQAGD